MGSGKIKKSNMADPRWPSDERHVTSSAYVADFKGNIFGCIKFRCHSLNILGVKRWGPNQPPPQVPEDPKKRVNPLSPNSDENEISLYIVTTRSNIQIIRIKKVKGYKMF